LNLFVLGIHDKTQKSGQWNPSENSLSSTLSWCEARQVYNIRPTITRKVEALPDIFKPVHRPTHDGHTRYNVAFMTSWTTVLVA